MLFAGIMAVGLIIISAPGFILGTIFEILFVSFMSGVSFVNNFVDGFQKGLKAKMDLAKSKKQEIDEED
jgi:5-bromo-4-chloroindolyl phosphate hydrolysis protein